MRNKKLTTGTEQKLKTEHTRAHTHNITNRGQALLHRIRQHMTSKTWVNRTHYTKKSDDSIEHIETSHPKYRLERVWDTFGASCCFFLCYVENGQIDTEFRSLGMYQKSRSIIYYWHGPKNR